MRFSATLLFDGLIWRGACPDFTIWMDDATFQKYVQGYFVFHRIANPTSEQRKQAVEHCRRIVFWIDCWKNCDRDVHVKRFIRGYGMGETTSCNQTMGRSTFL